MVVSGWGIESYGGLPPRLEDTREERFARSQTDVVGLQPDDGQVFRVGGGVVWLMRPWTTVGHVKKEGTWDPAALGEKLSAELATGVTKGDDLGQVFAALQ